MARRMNVATWYHKKAITDFPVCMTTAWGQEIKIHDQFITSRYAARSSLKAERLCHKCVMPFHQQNAMYPNVYLFLRASVSPAYSISIIYDSNMDEPVCRPFRGRGSEPVGGDSEPNTSITGGREEARQSDSDAARRADLFQRQTIRDRTLSMGHVTSITAPRLSTFFPTC